MSQIYSGLSTGHDSQPLQKGQNDTDRMVSSSLTCKTVAMVLASGKNKVKCILGLWLLQTQALLEGGYSFSLLPTFSAKTH